MIYSDLEKRTFLLARSTNEYCKTVAISILNTDYIRQLIRSSASVGANYREAHNAFTVKDQIFRLKIARKEARESIYWLSLLEGYGDNSKRCRICNEALELTKIISTMIKNKELKVES